MDLFAQPIFDATIVVEGNDLFKGQGSARQWGERLAAELKTPIEARKLGNGWALFGTVDGVEAIWALHGQRLKRIN
ncbi:MAG: hypothetical protein V4508_01230 [Pseudomonadota bacterium]